MGAASPVMRHQKTMCRNTVMLCYVRTNHLETYLGFTDPLIDKHESLGEDNETLVDEDENLVEENGTSGVRR